MQGQTIGLSAKYGQLISVIVGSFIVARTAGSALGRPNPKDTSARKRQSEAPQYPGRSQAAQQADGVDGTSALFHFRMQRSFLPRLASV